VNYAEALAYLDGFVNYERQMPDKAGRATFTLDRIQALSARLGEPHRRFKSVHVAGTKGKGSTAIFAESIARAAGLSVGTYTSPHLVDLRERIRLDGAVVSEELLARTLSACRAEYEAVRAAAGDRRLTYFEALTHLAFQIFAERKVDLAVVEVGMGGRLDATNIITPLAAAITPISLDHTKQLGETLAEIAGEKAGIAKPGVPLAVGEQPPEALAAIRERAAARGAAPVLVLGQDFRMEPGERRPGEWRRMTLATPARTYRDLVVRMLGAHQLGNAATAVAAMEFAAERGGFALSEDVVRRGLEAAEWPGRVEIACRQPVLTVLDGAHNADSARKLLASVDEEFPGRAPLALVFAAAADKDVDGMLQVLAPRSALVVATESGNPRRLDPRIVAELAKTARAGAVTIKRDMGEALAAAWEAAGPKGIVLVTGSLYLVGRAKKHLE
jgi:dihydrofolate synthase/folylpolyglutamate synthase